MPQRSLQDACMKAIVAEMINVDPPRRSLTQIAPYRYRYCRQEQRVGGGPAIAVVDDYNVELILQARQCLEGVVGNTAFGRRQRGMKIQQAHRWAGDDDSSNPLNAGTSERTPPVNAPCPPS